MTKATRPQSEMQMLDRLMQHTETDEEERRHLAEVLFEAPEIAKDPIFCYFAALHRRAQITAGLVCPPWPLSTLTRSLGPDLILEVEIPPRSRCCPPPG